MRRLAPALVLLPLVLAACGGGRKSSAGFRLPDGDVHRGRAIFAEMKCSSCHEVAGESFPAPIADPPVAVTLGGVVSQPRTDGELFTAIVNPSHRLARPGRDGVVASGRLSRMGDFGEALTVHDLVDVVAYVQSTYEVVPPPAGP
jgi:mono/diheme cytochrome c family protein